MGYRSKYAELIKVENEEPNNYCDFCGQLLVNVEFIATDRPPPDYEFLGLVSPYDWFPTESIEEAEERRHESKLYQEQKKQFDRPMPDWINKECYEASQKANDLLKTLNN